MDVSGPGAWVGVTWTWETSVDSGEFSLIFPGIILTDSGASMILFLGVFLVPMRPGWLPGVVGEDLMPFPADKDEFAASTKGTPFSFKPSAASWAEVS